MNRSRARNASKPWLTGVLASALVLLGLSPAAANHGNQRLEVTPEVSSRPAGSTQTLTATETFALGRFAQSHAPMAKSTLKP